MVGNLNELKFRRIFSSKVDRTSIILCYFNGSQIGKSVGVHVCPFSVTIQETLQMKFEILTNIV